MKCIGKIIAQILLIQLFFSWSYNVVLMADVKLSLQADVLKWDNLSAKDMLENLKLAKIRANNRFNIIIFISFTIILCPQHLLICT